MKSKTGFSPVIIDSLKTGTLSDPLTSGLSAKALPGGKIAWKFMRWIPTKGLFFRRTLGYYPQVSIAMAREAAAPLNITIDAGRDPRDLELAQRSRNEMTVDRAHELYMVAVREGRHRKRARMLKPVTIEDKIWRYNKYLKSKIGKKVLYDVTEDDLIRIVASTQKTGRYQARVKTQSSP